MSCFVLPVSFFLQLKSVSHRQFSPLASTNIVAITIARNIPEVTGSRESRIFCCRKKTNSLRKSSLLPRRFCTIGDARSTGERSRFKRRVGTSKGQPSSTKLNSTKLTTAASTRILKTAEDRQVDKFRGQTNGQTPLQYYSIDAEILKTQGRLFLSAYQMTAIDLEIAFDFQLSNESLLLQMQQLKLD